MWFIYISLCIGILIGATNVIPKKILKYCEALTMMSVFILLFIMGLSIGINKDVIKSIKELGLAGLTYASLTVIFSIIVAYLLTNKIGGKKKCE